MNNADKQFKITFLPDNIEVTIPKGSTLLEAAEKAEIKINTECGGAGLCGKCRVKLIKGKITSRETFLLSERDRQSGYILACTSLPSSDITVELPQSSTFADSGLFESVFHRLHKIQMPFKYDPLVEKVYIECSPPDRDNNISDLDRLYLTLKQKTGISDFRLSAGLLRKLSDYLRDSDWKITVTFTRLTSPCPIIDIEQGDQSRFNYGMVLDVGTTTIEAASIDLASGNILYFASYLNPQVKYGESITDRLNFASSGNGLLILNDIIIDRINEIITEMIFESGGKNEYFKSILISCNTVMMHFILGLNTNRILKSPNVPVALEVPFYNANDVNLYPGDALVFFSPCPGSFVGGDITSAIISTGMPRKDYLLVDIGTNGEVAISIEGALACASTSAGPAFEGGGIKWGRRASGGAINRFYYQKRKRDFALMTIGNTRPNGICGVGLIDFLATLMLTGFIDKKGKFQKRSSTTRFKVIDGEEHFIISKSDKDEETISITEKELNYLIHSKGALYAGLEFLLNRFEKKFQDIDSFFISGALGGSIDIENGITIGLFPDIGREKFMFLGNGSLRGGIYMLLSGEAWATALETARSIAYFDLSVEPEYMNLFISSLFLPHTDTNKFPRVMKMLPENNNHPL